MIVFVKNNSCWMLICERFSDRTYNLALEVFKCIITDWFPGLCASSSVTNVSSLTAGRKKNTYATLLFVKSARKKRHLCTWIQEENSTIAEPLLPPVKHLLKISSTGLSWRFSTFSQGRIQVQGNIISQNGEDAVAGLCSRAFILWNYMIWCPGIDNRLLIAGWWVSLNVIRLHIQF